MKFSAFRTTITIATSSALLVAGCGGGASGDASAPAPDRNARINSANAANVGAQAYWALDFLNSQINAAVLNVASATDEDLSSKLCKVKNEATGSYEIRGSSKRAIDTATNTVTLTDVNCDNGVWVSNGTQTIKLSNLNGTDPFHDAAWQGTLTITFDYRTSIDPTFNSWISSQSGDLSVEYVQTAPNVGTFKATNNSLQSRFDVSAGGSAVIRNISQLDYTGKIDSSGLNTLSADFTLQGSFGALGTTSYGIKKTTTEFARQISTDHILGKPYQGAMIVKATDNSSLTLTAAPTEAQLAVDWNGDNVIDSTATQTWDNLGSLANPIYMLTH